MKLIELIDKNLKNIGCSNVRDINPMKTETEIIHLVLSIWDLTDKYNRHAAVTLTSFLEHTKRPVTIHLLHDDRNYSKDISTGNENILKYKYIADKYGAKVSYHSIYLPDWIYQLKEINTWSPGALLRIYIPEILKDLPKIIYLDCDIVVNTDIQPLWDVKLDEVFLAAVHDSGSKHCSLRRKLLYSKSGICRNTYFCSGILLMNPQKLYENKFTKKTLDYLKNYPNTPYPDQDAINYVMKSAYIPLDEKYNIYSGREDCLNYVDDCIIHYADIFKPWSIYTGEIDNYYWKYLLLTPWGDNREELVIYSRECLPVEICIKNIPKVLVAVQCPAKILYAVSVIGRIIKAQISFYWKYLVK